MLKVEPPEQFIERDHHVLTERRAKLKPFIPRFHIRNVGPLDIQFEIAIEVRPDRNIAQAQTVSRNEGPLGQHPVEKLEMLCATSEVLVNALLIA